MRIKPRTWVFVGDFCCREFQWRAESGECGPFVHIFTDGKKVVFGGITITNCPFCGKKIVLDKVS